MRGEYRKGAYLFIAVVLFRFHDINKEPHRIELNLGIINDPKDNIEFLISSLKIILIWDKWHGN